MMGSLPRLLACTEKHCDGGLRAAGARLARHSVADGLRQLDLLLGPLGIPADRLRVIANAIGGPGSASRSQITETIAGHLAKRGVTWTLGCRGTRAR